MGIPGGRMFVSPEGDGNMVENACDELFEVHRNNVLDKEMYKEFCKDMSVIYPPTHADYRCVDCRNCGTCRRMSRYEGSKISRREEKQKKTKNRRKEEKKKRREEEKKRRRKEEKKKRIKKKKR